MQTILIVIALHVAMGATWALTTLGVAAFGRARVSWLRLMLIVAVINMLAGIYLWHALHRGTWGPGERWLVVGSFCAMIAIGLQAPIALTMPSDARRLEPAALWVYRATALFVVAAAAAMIASKA